MAEKNYIDLAGLKVYDTTRVAGIKDEVEKLSQSFKLPSLTVSEAEPGTKEKGAVWFDTASKVVKVYDGASWVSFGAVYQ